MQERRRAGYRRALEHRDFRLLMGRLTVSAIGSWAYNVGLVVFVFEQTGSAAWLSSIAAARFLPALLASPYGGVLAEKFERRGVMMTSDLIATLMMTGLAVLAAVEGPVWIALVLGGLTSVVTIVDEPAMSAVVPQVVGEEDLAAANALKAVVDNVSVIVGPALGAGLLLLMPVEGVFAINAATFLSGAIFLLGFQSRSEPTDVSEGGSVSMLRQTAVGFRAIASDRKAFVLVLLSVLASFVYGTDIVLFALVGERLGLGADGFGYLLAGLGVGGVLAAGLVDRLSAAPRLGVILMTGMALYVLPTAGLVFTDSPAVAVAIQVVRGAGTLVVDVLAVTALQRTLAPELLSRVFGVFMSLVLLAIAMGSIVTPPIIEASSLDGALWVMSVGLMGVSLVFSPLLRRVDAASAAKVAELAPKVEALAGLGIFQAAPQAMLERLAAAAEERRVATRTTIIEQGEPADSFYVILQGSVLVSTSVDGQPPIPVRELTAPAYLGEIGLIEQVPRTASVTTTSGVHLLRIDGQDFLDALTTTRASAAFLEATAARYASVRAVRPVEPAAEEVIDVTDPVSGASPPDAGDSAGDPADRHPVEQRQQVLVEFDAGTTQGVDGGQGEEEHDLLS